MMMTTMVMWDDDDDGGGDDDVTQVTALVPRLSHLSAPPLPTRLGAP
jgi:hypothetical protein